MRGGRWAGERSSRSLTWDHPFSIHAFRRAAARLSGSAGRRSAAHSAGRHAMPVGPEKEKAIELAVSSIEKAFGRGSIMRLGNEQALVKDAQAVSTGSVSLDIALGVGGLPRGRIIEIYGPESSGKTTLALHAIAEAQKRGGIAAFVPKAELEGEMGDAHMGVQARLMSQALRKLTGTISKSSSIVIFINQIRMKIGVMFGNPETTTGGNALKFYATQRLDIRRIGAIKDGEQVIGNRTRVKVVKNKVAPPFKEVEFDIMYGHGISREGDVLDLASNENIVEKSGAWFSFGGERIGQGREQAKAFLREHPEALAQIETKIFERFGVKAPVSAPAAEVGEPGVEKRPREPRVKAVR